MKSLIKKVWDAIPDYDRLRKSIGWGGDIGATFVLLVWFMAAVGVGVMYDIPTSHYNLALTAIVISRVLVIAFVLFALKTVTNKYLRTFFGFLIAVQVVAFINVIFPFYLPDQNSNSKLLPDTTYVTYSSACPYCTISHMQMARSVQAYNQTHVDKVVLVNLDKNDTTATSLKKLIPHSGEAVRIDKHGVLSQHVYTVGNKKGPVAPSTDYVYGLIESLN